VLAEAQVLEQQARTAQEYDQFVASVQDQLRQLVRLVDSLLTLALADAGFSLAAARSVSMNEVVMEAVERCEPVARHREVRLVPILAPPAEDGIEAYVSGDSALLRAAIDNLIRNAVRYSPAEEAVEVEVGVAEQEVRVAIRDNGPGIPSDELDRVFDRFFHMPRGDEVGQGAGLGLAIARGVATLHHGSISASNRASGGCEFTLRLPLAIAENGAD
jgi:signal transduction histidine kinase